MSTTQHTGHYNLPTFGDNPNDRPSWRGDFTDAMTKIDNQMYANATNITTATAAANNATAAAGEAKKAASGAQSTANDAVDRLDALGATDATQAGRIKTKIDSTATDLGSFKTTTNDSIAALQRKDTETDGSIAGINANLTALGVNGTSEATRSKTKWDTAASNATRNASNITKNTTDITRNIRILRNSIGYNDNIVVIGDSWVDGYYGGAKHPTDSPANAIYDILSPSTKQTLGTSAGGFFAAGDSGTFLDRWNTVPNKSSVDRVIIIGGQNDAEKLHDGTAIADIEQKTITTLNTISQEAPNAIIDVFPMCLGVGESMSRTTNQIQGDPRTIVYKMITRINNIPNLVIHEGAYRAGVWASYASDGGDDNDGAHLSKLGYVEFGHAVGSCILHGKTFFPTTDGGVNDSQLPGAWKYINVFETGGILSIVYNIQLSGPVSNGFRIFKVPKCLKVGATRYWHDFSDKYFVSFGGDTLAIQAANNLGKGDIVAGSQSLLAGF